MGDACQHPVPRWEVFGANGWERVNFTQQRQGFARGTVTGFIEVRYCMGTGHVARDLYWCHPDGTTCARDGPILRKTGQRFCQHGFMLHLQELRTPPASPEPPAAPAAPAKGI